MTTAAMLMKEIETLPEESVAEALDFVLFLRTRTEQKRTLKNRAWSMEGSLMNNKSLHLGKIRSWTREELYER
ncbi:MAG: DUF2281 domain-containing protein [Fibromonadaceae bacterium]|jgi:hypothetical protein|nr:DUF2281 domain-containing protein [Fibromonadaceae bacterium]